MLILQVFNTCHKACAGNSGHQNDQKKHDCRGRVLHTLADVQSEGAAANQCTTSRPHHRRPDHLLILAGRPPHGSHLPRRFARRNRNLRVTARAGHSLTGKLHCELHGLAAIGAVGRCRFIQEGKIAHLRNCHPLRTEKQRAGGV